MFLKCINMKQVNTTNSKTNNMFMDEWRLFTEKVTAAATTTTVYNTRTDEHTHKYKHLIPINNATKREKHEINNFQRENWIWGVKNTNDANTNDDDLSQMCCMRERIFHKEEAWNIRMKQMEEKNIRYSLKTYTQIHTMHEENMANIPISFSNHSRMLFNWIIVYRWIMLFQIEPFSNYDKRKESERKQQIDEFDF